MKVLNYFLSWWIANLGVVPLFSLAFFLFDPAFLALSLLLALVCVVFDAILISSIHLITTIFRAVFLSRLNLVVKIFIISGNLQAITQSNNESKEIFLAKGEQIELKVGKIKSFSVGNKEVITYAYRPTKGSILIKGKSLGMSDIIAWSGKKQVYKIYVLSKREQLNKAAIAQSLSQNGLSTRIRGNIIYVKGVLKTLSAYKTYIQSKKLNKKPYSFIYELKITKELRNEIIAEVYQRLAFQGASSVNCHLIDLDFYCEYAGNIQSKYLSSIYDIKLKSLPSINQKSNFKINFMFISTEKRKGLNRTFGMDKLNFSVKKLMENGDIQLNSLDAHFQNRDISIKSTTNSSLKTILNDSFELQLGSQIPFKQNSHESNFIQWKFAGLKLNGKVLEKEGELILQINTELSIPSSGSVSGPKSKSKTFFELGKPIEIFSISAQGLNFQKKYIPFIEKIPIFRSFFSSSDKENKLQKIICYAKIERL